MKKDLWCRELLWPLPSYNHHCLTAKDFEEVCHFYHSSTQHGSCFVNSLPHSCVLLVYPTAWKELLCCEYSWKGTRTRAQSERERKRQLVIYLATTMRNNWKANIDHNYIFEIDDIGFYNCYGFPSGVILFLPVHKARKCPCTVCKPPPHIGFFIC